MTDKKQKWELPITATLKVQEYDDRNVVLLQQTNGKNPKTGEPTINWKNIGYFGNVRSALKRVLDLDLLISHEEFKSLPAYQEALKKQCDRLEELLKDGAE